MQRDNFLAIINGFATLDAVLMKHLEKGAKNAKMVSWQIQIGIIECLSEFVWSKIKDEIPDYYSIMADEVTDRLSYKEILLLCLRDVNFAEMKSLTPRKHFLILNTFKNIAKSISLLLLRNGVDILNVILKHMMRHLQRIVKHQELYR